MFIGDGINDAPALVTATVGLAFGHQSEITAEAAGAVIMDTSLKRVDELLHIAGACARIALQSAVGGMALSVVGMCVAAAGLLPPVAGAVVQEIIDLAAVLNALRAAVPGGVAERLLSGAGGRRGCPRRLPGVPHRDDEVRAVGHNAVSTPVEEAFDIFGTIDRPHLGDAAPRGAPAGRSAGEATRSRPAASGTCSAANGARLKRGQRRCERRSSARASGSDALVVRSGA